MRDSRHTASGDTLAPTPFEVPVSIATRRHLRISLPIAAATILSLGTSTGCSNFNPRGDGYSESFEQSAGVKRPVEPSAKPFGYSTKAQEIERDFGIR